MSSTQDLILSLLERSKSWLSISDIASRLTDQNQELFRPRQIRQAMTGLNNNHLVERRIELNSAGSRVAVFRKI